MMPEVMPEHWVPYPDSHCEFRAEWAEDGTCFRFCTAPAHVAFLVEHDHRRERVMCYSACLEHFSELAADLRSEGFTFLAESVRLA